MEHETFTEMVAFFEGTTIERDAQAYCECDWDRLTDFQKFTWLAFAERRQQRDI